MLFRYSRRATFKFSTLIIAEHNNKTLVKSMTKLLKAAEKLKQDSHLLITGDNTESVVANAKSTLPASILKKIITVDSPAFKHYLSENLESVVKQLIEKNKYKNVIALSSSIGKDIIPRVAASYDCQPISDVTEVIDDSTFIRPTYAGNAFSKVKSSDPIKFLTFRPTSFDEATGKSESVEVEKLADPAIPQDPKTKFLKEQLSNSNKPQLTSARIVVSGGRGVKSKENFKIIEDLASAFGDAAVGASRAAVDAGYCPNELQVGQTGKVVAPELYIAVGISGAVQHLAGMKDSKVIVAINNRPEQAIFELATYGLVGDLFKVLPELTEKIKKLK